MSARIGGKDEYNKRDVSHFVDTQPMPFPVDCKSIPLIVVGKKLSNSSWQIGAPESRDLVAGKWKEEKFGAERKPRDGFLE